MVGRRIVVGIDGSPEAQEALRWACRLACLWRAGIVVVHALGLPERGDGGLAGAPRHEADIDRLVAEERATTALREGGALRTVVREGRPVDVLVDTARAEAADLVVVGTRGLGATPALALALGSISLRLLQVARWPVLVIPAPSGAAMHRALRRILVAVDSVEPSVDAVELAVDLAAALDAWVTLVHAVEEVPVFPLGPATTVSSEGEVAAPARDRARLEELRQLLLERGVPADVRVVRGPARDVVLATAAKIGPDLVVVGSATTRRAGHPLVGSVSRQIAATAQRPTLVVPDGWLRSRRTDPPVSGRVGGRRGARTLPR